VATKFAKEGRRNRLVLLLRLEGENSYRVQLKKTGTARVDFVDV
jgi:hypothetical protein